MSISKREKILIIVVVLLALIGAYYLYYLKPCLDDIKELNAEIAGTETQISISETQKKQIEKIEAEIADVDEQLSLFGGSVAQVFDQPPVLVYLSDTVKACGAAKATINFNEPEQIGQIERCTITIMMISTYDQLKRVLDAFANAPYLIRLTQLRVVLSSAQETLGGTTGEDETIGDAQTDPATTPEADQTVQPAPQLLNVTITLDFFSLSGDIPEDATYVFDTERQFGGDIFY
jgi:Tfp pilus assembly protein PilO